MLRQSESLFVCICLCVVLVTMATMVRVAAQRAIIT